MDIFDFCQCKTFSQNNGEYNIDIEQMTHQPWILSDYLECRIMILDLL